MNDRDKDDNYYRVLISPEMEMRILCGVDGMREGESMTEEDTFNRLRREPWFWVLKTLTSVSKEYENEEQFWKVLEETYNTDRNSRLIETFPSLLTNKRHINIDNVRHHGWLPEDFIEYAEQKKQEYFNRKAAEEDRK